MILFDYKLSFTKVCLGGKRIGYLLEVGSGALEIRPLHLSFWSSNRRRRLGIFLIKKGKFVDKRGCFVQI